MKSGVGRMKDEICEMKGEISCMKSGVGRMRVEICRMRDEGRDRLHEEEA